MKTLTEKMKGARFLVLGRAGMDLYPDPPGTKIEDAVNMVSHLGGSSANIAVALTKQGSPAALVTRVADDAVGRFCINQLLKYGVNVNHVIPLSGEYRTSLAIAESTTEDHQSVLYRNGAADFIMEKADIDRIDMSAYDAIIFTGTLLASQPSRDTVFYALDKAKDSGLVRIFDIDYRPYSWDSDQEVTEIYAKAGSLSDIIVGNDDEFGFMAGSKEKSREFARDLARYSGGITVYKMGALGAISFQADKEIKTNIYPVNTLKPFGAGDAFIGGFLHALSTGWELRDAVLRGSACAAIVVSSVGCTPAMPDQVSLERFLKEHSTL